MLSPKQKTASLVFLFFYVLFRLGSYAPACNAPVFRYAMQYWKQNPYLIRCFHKGALEESDMKLLQRLEEQSLNKQSSFNFLLEIVDLSMPGSENLFPSSLPGDAWPCLVVYYPGGTERASAWHGHLDETILEQLTDSPLRNGIAESLSSGETAAWIFLESENRQMDSEKLSLLKEELQKLESGLKFPDQSQTVHYTDDMNPDNQDNLRIKFSSFVLSRSDPKEQILLSLLLHSESDLENLNSLPMVFPVYGRGRVLYALVGKGITPENIRKTAEYFIAPCTCILKESNTGTDLLMTTDWGGAAGKGNPVSTDQQSLSGLREYLPDDQAPGARESREDAAPEINRESLVHKKIRSRIIVSILIIPAAVLFLALAVIVKRKST